MDEDWEFWWGGSKSRPQFRVERHPAPLDSDFGDFSWGSSTSPEIGGPPKGPEGDRRRRIAEKCWSIIDDYGIPADMVQRELSKIDLELVRTARILRVAQAQAPNY